MLETLRFVPTTAMKGLRHAKNRENASAHKQGNITSRQYLIFVLSVLVFAFFEKFVVLCENEDYKNYFDVLTFAHNQL